jgi:prepilin-type N-terminal cleavage/methylation domain-containing protein/prepilin-type processing-associated H-X9-DG protein
LALRLPLWEPPEPLTELNLSMHQRPKHRGFTIVEMLAVIGVIVVLLAILVPTISSARRSALWGTSQSNLKQVGQLLMLYVQENRDAIAPTAFDYSTSLAPGKVRTASPAGVVPPTGPLSVGTWTDILWTTGKLGPTLNVAATASAWDYRFDSPDAALYASGWSGSDPFRSAEQLKKPAGGNGATPFGTGAPATELGDPGYFGGNPFFDARPPTTARPYSGFYYTLGQMKRPEASMYCVDSNLGELLEVNDPTLNPNNPNLNLVGVEWRYVGDKCLMLFLDGHVETYDKWGDLRELEQEFGVRVFGLDRSSFFSNP